MGLFGNGKSKFSLNKKKDEFLLSEESALEQLMPVLEMYDFDIDGELDEDVKKHKETVAENALEFIRLGWIEVDQEKSIIIQNLKHPFNDVKQIKYSKFRGKNKRAMDGYKQDAIQSKAFALVGSVSGLGIEFFDGLEKYDISVAETIGMLFLL